MDLTLTEQERLLLAADDRRTARTGLWLAVIAAMLLASAAIVCWHATEWLRAGEWPTLSLRTVIGSLGIAVPRTSWIGLQRIVSWLADCPFAGWLFCLALSVSFIVFRDRDDSEAIKVARMKRARRAAGWNS